MQQRLRYSAGIALYLTAVVVCPGLHLSHHAAAHAHDGGGLEGDELPEHAIAADLVALGLEDVGAPSRVDCTLAALTLADCDTPAHGVRRFGDARAHRPEQHDRRNLDPRHGAGALEHLGASLLAARAFELPPPRCPETRLELIARPVAVSLAFRRPHFSRGPPAVSV
jgi:hypothetical protein